MYSEYRYTQSGSLFTVTEYWQGKPVDTVGVFYSKERMLEFCKDHGIKLAEITK